MFYDLYKENENLSDWLLVMLNYEFVCVSTCVVTWDVRQWAA